MHMSPVLCIGIYSIVVSGRINVEKYGHVEHSHTSTVRLSVVIK